MGLKTYAIGGLAVVLVIAATAWYRGKIREAELRGELREITVEAEAARVERDSVEAHYAPIVQQLQADADTLRRQLENTTADLRVAARSASRWRQRYDQVRNDTSATIADILEAADSTVSAATEEAKTCSLALRDCTSLTGNLEQQVTAQGVRLQAANDLTDAQARQIEAMKAAWPKPPVLPWAIAGTAVALLAAALVF